MPATFSPSRLQRLAETAQREIDEQIIAGCAVGIGNEHGLQFSSYQGLANLEDGIEITQDTLFRIASMTKPITSVATMMLYERGYFCWTTPWQITFQNSPICRCLAANETKKVMR